VDVTTGLKTTPLGTFPADWDYRDVGSLDPFVTSGSRGWAKRYTEFGAAFIRITNMSREAIDLDLSDLKQVRVPADDAEANRTQLRAGDVLVSITADIGVVSWVGEGVPSPAYINQHVSLIRFLRPGVDSRYVAYFLAAEASQRAFRAQTDQGAKAGMNLEEVRRVRLVLPSEAEQTAIATALSDVDTLLTKLDQLIAKKRDLKQAAMQQLLSGRIRLPGFIGEWRERSLADLCSMRSGEGIISDSIDEHSAYPCFGGNGLRGYTKRFTHDGTFVLIGRQGALCGNVLIASGRFFASEHAVVATPSQDVDANWLAAVLTKMQLGQYSESSAQPGLAVARLRRLRYRAPEFAEQTAIAAVLTDMGAELAALEARRDKTRQLKQGMMQVLLTGRIRLV
jgi:type I restriction enzyme, S subunit